MQQVLPTFRITDVDRSRAFYEGALGFSVDWEWRSDPGLPVFMSISHSGLTLYLTKDPECGVGSLVYLFVTDVDEWHARITANGVRVDWPPTDQPWGMREMQVRDPDGNKLRICTRREGA